MERTATDLMVFWYRNILIAAAGSGRNNVFIKWKGYKDYNSQEIDECTNGT